MKKNRVSATANRNTVLLAEAFQQPLDTNVWKIELQPSPGSTVAVADSGLELRTGAGVTVWLRRKLTGNLLITYDREVVMQGGPFDRLSDLNQFWMSTDPHNENLFTRSGKLEDYDSLLLYYVGMGGNSNSTTRFRRYDGQGNRVLIGEWKDTEHLLVPNTWLHISIMVNEGEIIYKVNDQPYFSYKDPVPLTSGYFGFRSTKSHQLIRNLKIEQLP